MTEKRERCRQHCRSVCARKLSELSKGRALDESLHHFSGKRPTGKNPTALDRAIGLTSVPFWRGVAAVARSELARLALKRWGLIKIFGSSWAVTVGILRRACGPGSSTPPLRSMGTQSMRSEWCPVRRWRSFCVTRSSSSGRWISLTRRVRIHFSLTDLLDDL